MRVCVNSPYRVTLKYGATSTPYSASNPHNGVDLVSDDKRIVAPEAGTITYYANTNGKSGWMMTLQGKYRHTFSHTVAGSNKVPVGTKVVKGQHLATMGATGFVSGVHVHWVVNSGALDPMKLITEEDMTTKTSAIWLLRTLQHKHSPSDASIANWTGLNNDQLIAKLEKVYGSDWFKAQTAKINEADPPTTTLKSGLYKVN